MRSFVNQAISNRMDLCFCFFLSFVRCGMTTSHSSCDSAILECVCPHLFLDDRLSSLTAVSPAARNCSLQNQNFTPVVMEYRRWWYAHTQRPLKIYARCVEDIQSFAECHVVGIWFGDETSIEAHKLAVTLFQGSLRELRSVRLTPGTVLLIGRCSHLEYLHCRVVEVPSLTALEKLSDLQIFEVVSFTEAAVGALDNFLHVFPNLSTVDFHSIAHPHFAPLLIRSVLRMAYRMATDTSNKKHNIYLHCPAEANALNALQWLTRCMRSSLEPKIGHHRSLMDMDKTFDDSVVGDFIQLGLQSTSDRCISTFLRLIERMYAFSYTHLYCDPRFGELLLQWVTRVADLQESASLILSIFVRMFNTLNTFPFSTFLIRDVLLKIHDGVGTINFVLARDMGCIIGTLCNHSAENLVVFGVPGIRNIVVRCAHRVGYSAEGVENVADALAAITQDNPANQKLFATKEVCDALVILSYAGRIATMEVDRPVTGVTRAYRNIMQQKAGMTDEVLAVFESPAVIHDLLSTIFP